MLRMLVNVVERIVCEHEQVGGLALRQGAKSLSMPSISELFFENA